MIVFRTLCAKTYLSLVSKVRQQVLTTRYQQIKLQGLYIFAKDKLQTVSTLMEPYKD